PTGSERLARRRPGVGRPEHGTCVVDEEQRGLPDCFERRGDLVIVRARADAASAEARDDDACRVAERGDDALERDGHVRVAVLMNRRQIRVRRVLVRSMAVDAAMREYDEVTL